MIVRNLELRGKEINEASRAFPYTYFTLAVEGPNIYGWCREGLSSTYQCVSKILLFNLQPIL
jgi:hypothetical protein